MESQRQLSLIGFALNSLSEREIPTRAGEKSLKPRPIPLPLTSSLAIVVATIEITGLTDWGPVGFGALALAFAVTVVHDSRRAQGPLKLNFGRGMLASFYAAWVSVISVGAITRGMWEQDTFIIFFGALLLGLAPLAMASTRPAHKPSESSTLILKLSTVAFGIVALGVEVATIVGLEGFGRFSHERVYVALFVLSLSRAANTKSISVLIWAGLVLSFVRYPSATTLLALVVFVLLRAALRINLRRLWVIAGAIIASMAFVLVINGRSLLNEFYLLVGRTDNSGTREYLWAQAETVLAQSPWFGGAASVSITGLANVNGVVQPVPYHNSMLTVGVVAGWPAVALLCALLLIVILGEVFSRKGSLASQSVWLPALAASVVSLAFNPVLEKPGLALIFYTLLALSLVRNESRLNG